MIIEVKFEDVDQIDLLMIVTSGQLLWTGNKTSGSGRWISWLDEQLLTS